MKITFHNESVLDIEGRPTQYYPFPNLASFEGRKYRFGIGILGMSGNTWEERIMYRLEYNGGFQFRFLIFAVVCVNET